ncbi:hypothetical protein ES705_19942 [subsurface metagenome]
MGIPPNLPEGWRAWLLFAAADHYYQLLAQDLAVQKYIERHERKVRRWWLKRPSRDP